MKQFFLNIVLSFNHFALLNRRNTCFIFFLVLLAWALAVFSFSRIELSTTSADLLPDSSIKLQKMAKGMDLAPFSRLFFIDIYEKEGNTEILEQSAMRIEASVPRNIALPLHEQANIKPEDLMQYLPNFFTKEAELKAYENIEENKAKATLDQILQQLSTFAPATLANWLRIDPFDFKESILSALPASFSSASSRQASFSFSNFVYSEDKKHILLTFQPLVSIHDTNSAKILLEEIRKIAKTLPPSVELNFNGGIVHTAVNTQVIENDIKNVVFFSLIGLIILYITLVRSFSGIWLLLTPALAISLSLGLMTSISTVISGLALGFGAAVLGIAEDYAVHVHCALEKEKNTDKILSILTIPLFQGFILNISGFAVLTLSSLPAIRQLAYFAILSLCFGFLIALFILPLCPRFKSFCKTKKLETFSSSQTPTVMKPLFSRCFLLVSSLLTFSFFLFIHTKVDVSPQSMGMSLDFADTNSKKFSQTWSQANSSSQGSLFILDSDDEEELFHTARLTNQALSEALNTALEKQNNTEKRADNIEKNTQKIDTLAYFFPSTASQEENIQRFKLFVEKNSLYIQNLLEEKSIEFALPSALFTPFLNILNKKPHLLTTEHLSQSSLSPLLDFFVLKRQVGEKIQLSTLFISPEKLTFDNEDPLFANLVELSPEALEKEILSSFYSEARFLPLALLLCTLLLYLFYFDIAKTLLALTPALFSLFSVLLGMFILQSPLTLGALTALLLVLGLALDHGILVSCDLEKGIDFGLRRALLISSLSTILGIGLLAFATHPTLRDMGRIILFGLLLEVPVSLYLLPLLCKKVTKKEKPCT